MSLGCKVCDDLVMKETVNIRLRKGQTFAFIARFLTMNGTSVTAETISKHAKHYRDDEIEPPSEKPALLKRDLAVLVRDRMYDAIEAMPTDAMLVKDFQPALANAIRAQGAIDKRETKKVGSQTFILQLAAAMGERLGITAGPEIIEGEATQVE